MKKIRNIMLVLVTLLTLTGCNKEEIKENNTLETNIKGERILDDFTFKNISIVEDNGISRITVTVVNNSEEDKNVESFKILLKDKEENIIKETIGYIGGTIKSKDTKVIMTEVNMDLSNVYDIDFTY